MVPPVQAEELARLCARLEGERAKYVDLFENAPDAYVVTTAHGILSEANIAAGRLFGVTARALVGKALIGFVARQDPRQFRALVRELEGSAGRGDVRTLTIRMRPRGEPVFVASLRVVAARGLRGQPTAFRWTIR